jgi:protein TorT
VVVTVNELIIVGFAKQNQGLKTESKGGTAMNEELKSRLETLLLCVLFVLGIIVVGPSLQSAPQKVAAAEPAAEKWWPYPVIDKAGNKHDYVALTEKATKEYSIVALLPHMKDKTWLAANYGLVMEAKRLGVKLTIFEAGGYVNLNRQISQFDDAVAMRADAIISGVISEAGMSKKVNEGLEKGIVQVAFINPIFEAPFDGIVFIDQEIMGVIAAELVAAEYKTSDHVKTIVFPGPQGSGWAENYAKGFRNGLNRAAPGKFEILEEKYGDTGKSVQLKLVEDALQSYDDVDLLYGNTPMAEVAINVLEERNLEDKVKIMASYANEDVLAAVKRGDMMGCVLEMIVAQARIAVDIAVRALDNKPPQAWEVHPVPVGVTQDNVEKVNLSNVFSPDGYKPIYKVD